MIAVNKKCAKTWVDVEQRRQVDRAQILLSSDGKFKKNQYMKYILQKE